MTQIVRQIPTEEYELLSKLTAPTGRQTTLFVRLDGEEYLSVVALATKGLVETSPYGAERVEVTLSIAGMWLMKVGDDKR